MSERRMWPTPCANDDNKTPAAHMAMKARMKGGPRYTITSLQVAAKADATGYELPAAPTVSPQLMLFAEAFPANRTRLLVEEADLRTSATSGPSSCDSFASVNPDGSWRKTCQGYSQVTLDGSLETFSATWPRAGMTRNGIAYRRVPLAPLTDGTECGLLPTPVTSEGFNRRKADASKGRGNGLETVARMWPTPNVPNGGRKPKGGMSRTGMTPDGKKRQVGLENAVTMWPTPTQSDGMGGPGSSGRDGGENLRTAVNGSLNPMWVEWLMGYPLGWTALEASVIASCRRLRNGSRAAFSKPRNRGTDGRGKGSGGRSVGRLRGKGLRS